MGEVAPEMGHVVGQGEAGLEVGGYGYQVIEGGHHPDVPQRKLLRFLVVALFAGRLVCGVKC